MLTVASSSLLTGCTGIVLPMATLGDRIKQRREQLDLSQAALARALGITRSSISQIESGLTKGLKPDHLLKAATALSTTVEALVRGTAHPVIAGQETRESMRVYGSREELLLEHWRALTPGQQREFLKRIRAQAAANRLVVQINGRPLSTAPDKRIERSYGTVPPHRIAPATRRPRRKRTGTHDVDPAAGDILDQ